MALADLVKLYAADGEHAKADTLYGRSLAMFEKAPGPDHPNVGQSLNNLAALHDKLGTYAEADPAYDGMFPTASATSVAAARSKK